MQLSTHLMFRGECEAAFRFYADCLGGKMLTMLTYGASPAAGEVAANWRDKIVHATLTVGDTVLSGADILTEQYEQPKGFYVLLHVDDLPNVHRIFNALALDGAVRMPLRKTFWSSAFGVVVDRFGVPWEISCAQAPKQE